MKTSLADKKLIEYKMINVVVSIYFPKKITKNLKTYNPSTSIFLVDSLSTFNKQLIKFKNKRTVYKTSLFKCI